MGNENKEKVVEIKGDYKLVSIRIMEEDLISFKGGSILVAFQNLSFWEPNKKYGVEIIYLEPR